MPSCYGLIRMLRSAFNVLFLLYPTVALRSRRKTVATSQNLRLPKEQKVGSFPVGEPTATGASELGKQKRPATKPPFFPRKEKPHECNQSTGERGLEPENYPRHPATTARKTLPHAPALGAKQSPVAASRTPSKTDLGRKPQMLANAKKLVQRPRQPIDVALRSRLDHPALPRNGKMRPCLFERDRP